MKLLLILLLAVTPAIAQTVPVHLIDGAGKPVTLSLSVPHPTTDRAFITWHTVSQLATLADTENTQYCLRAPECWETNPIYITHHPRRPEMYAINEGIFALTVWYSHRMKRREDAARAFGATLSPSDHWWILPLLNTTAHVVGLAVTIAGTGR